jgi:hypothetical protein
MFNTAEEWGDIVGYIAPDSDEDDFDDDGPGDSDFPDNPMPGFPPFVASMPDRPSDMSSWILPLFTPVCSPVAYQLGTPPTRTSRMMNGVLSINGKRISIAGPQSVELVPADISALRFHRAVGQFYIVLVSDPCVYITPYLFAVTKMVRVVLESRNNKVYSALHRLFGGPGRCANCRFDMCASRLPCPRCGGMAVSPR